MFLQLDFMLAVQEIQSILSHEVATAVVVVVVVVMKGQCTDFTSDLFAGWVQKLEPLVVIVGVRILAEAVVGLKKVRWMDGDG